MAKTDIWMPLYIGDYLADTARLNTEQHGAYLLLIMDYWRNGPPPENDAVLAQITRLSPDAWSNAKSTLQAFFKHGSGFWIHTRIDAEKSASVSKKESAKAKAEAAAAKRWCKNASSNATSNATSKAQAMHKECPSPSHSFLPSTAIAVSGATTESTEVEQSTPIKPKQPRLITPEGETPLQMACRETWHAYSLAYSKRYGADPVRNATVSSQIKQFVQRIGADESPAVAAFYVDHNAQFYVKKMHSVGVLLTDAEKIRTEWATGRKMTNLEAKNAEQVDAVQAQVERVGRMLGVS